jgi:alkanesulfonate monooxygenase SsuD/methylene tetrahydromethanopterin reductase-like flavin-dependent oxidoreductase (luciferase family)
VLPFALRFDLRNPAFAGTTASERIRAAVDMAAWADERGCVAISISEHHGSADEYLPSPIVFAAALAARTQRARIMISALIAPLYDPVRLAEDLAVLDGIAGGRMDLVLGAGYVAEEFAMFGVPLRERGARMEEAVAVLRKAWTGEPFVHAGRTIRVTPRPHQLGGPAILLGGSSAAAARRAAAIGDGYVPVSDETWEVYRQELASLGKPDPGPRTSGPMITTVVASDVEAAWEELLPYFLHETNAYAAWLDGAGLTGPYASATPEELRARGQYRIVTPTEYRSELGAMGPGAFALVNPMVGGIPPDRAWESLELFEREVLDPLR